jgi:hypothetical protein
MAYCKVHPQNGHTDTPLVDVLPLASTSMLPKEESGSVYRFNVLELDHLCKRSIDFDLPVTAM